MTNLKLSYNLQFEDLYNRDGLVKIDAAFVKFLETANVELHNKFVAARAGTVPLEKKDESNLLIALAPILEDFIAEVFNIREAVTKLQFAHNELGDLFTAKRLFVQRAAAKYCKLTELPELNGEELRAQLQQLCHPRPERGPASNDKLRSPLGGGDDNLGWEKLYSHNVIKWMDANDTEKLTLAAKYSTWASNNEHIAKHSTIFKKPKKLDFANLVPMETIQFNGVTMQRLPHHEWRARDGFALTDQGGSLEYALDQANYCIYCHNQGKDQCSKGMWEKDRVVKKSPTNVNLAGCPLEEKISEMNMVKAQGFTIGALGIVTIDNPMCAGTGHRICNDCMKSCIYQKQSPVDIPQVETRSLKDVLNLPWGFEIYSLLTRWNPLNLARPLPKQNTGYKVLVAGLGPAGFTLAHHLMNDGHTVVGIDGLKIEPVDQSISGVDAHGKRHAFKPIRDINEIKENLSERSLAGFGGVAEYGITVRWDKNFLKIIRLLLERRTQFTMIGGVRFGSNITTKQAFELGFDHIALAMGAGKPTVVDMKNGLARGVRTASDFLMALQLTGAAKKDSIANLTVRLPVVVIGGGLTAVDSATESMAYYPVQVEKFLTRVEAIGKEKYFAKLNEEEKETAETFITHAKQLRTANGEQRTKLLNEWGGVTLAYRKNLADAPSYRLNHEEVELAFQEGINFLGDATPLEVILDKFGHAEKLRVKVGTEEKIIPARTILMAAGTSPNTIAAREEPQNFQLDGKYFQMVGEDGQIKKPEWISKPSAANVLMNEQKTISFFGDLHPDYAGNVVKAMGSAKQGYPVVSRVLAQAKPKNLKTDFNNLLRAKVHDVIRLTPTIIEVIVHAPLAAQNFQPGQFYRLQNFEAFAPKTGNREQGTGHSLEIIPYEKKYQKQVWDLHEKTLRKLGTFIPNNELDKDLDDIENNYAEFLLVMKNGTIAAMGGYKISGEKAEIKRMRVLPELQNSGLGKTLLETLEAKIAVKNYSEIILDTRGTSTEFFIKNGYRETHHHGEDIFFSKKPSTINHQPSTTLSMEGLALTGAWVDKEKGLMSTIVLEMGGSSDLCAYLKKGEPVVLMGPTGTPTEIPKNETVMLVGGGLGNAVLFSIGKAMRANGCKVLYFAGYKKPSDRYKIEDIEAASDVVIWACDEPADFHPNRPNDRFFTGNIVQAIAAYAKGELGVPTIKMQDAEHIVCIGSDRMMAAVAFARHNQLKPFLKNNHIAIGSINSPMQCMMKEICAQCLQRHVDPDTGKEFFVYSCFNQDQKLDFVDFNFLNDRLRQNGAQEKLTALWIDKSLRDLNLRSDPHLNPPKTAMG